MGMKCGDTDDATWAAGTLPRSGSTSGWRGKHIQRGRHGEEDETKRETARERVRVAEEEEGGIEKGKGGVFGDIG